MLKKLVLGACAVVVLLAALEAGSRVYDYGFRYRELEKAIRERRDLPLPFEEINAYLFKTGRCLRDPDLIWRYIPKANSPEFNSLGIRTRGGVDPAVAKPQGTYRIIVLGGSHPFGLCLPYSGTYACLLEEMLRKGDIFHGRAVEVINAAVPGYSTLQALNFLKTRLLRYSPDLLIVDAGNNDGIPLTPAYSVSDSRAVSGNRLFFPLLLLMDRSSFCWHLRAALSRMGKRRAGNAGAAATRVSVEENLRNLEEIRRIAAERKIGVIFIAQVRWENGRLARGFGARMEPCLDLYEELAKRADLSGYFIDPIHGSAKGHREIASIIYDYLAAGERTDPGERTQVRQ